MPFRGGHNTKAMEIKQSRHAAKVEKKIAAEKEKEDLRWKDEVTTAKLSKKEEVLAKQQEKIQRRAENRKLAEEECQTISSSKNTGKPVKLTRAEIQQRALLSSLAASKPVKKPVDDLFIENPNKVLAAEHHEAVQAGIEFISASSVAEFLDNTGTTVADRFPEKRLKAAHALYEEEWLPKLKAEFPTLKRSQLRERIWKQWLKSPENPINQVPI